MSRRPCTWCGKPNSGGLELGRQLRPNSMNLDLKLTIEKFFLEFCGLCQLTLEPQFKRGSTLCGYNNYYADPNSFLNRQRFAKKYDYTKYKLGK
jgi:hypothetical protein